MSFAKDYETAKRDFKPMSRKKRLSAKSSLQRGKKKKKSRRATLNRKQLVKLCDVLAFDYVRLRDEGRCVECGSQENPTTGHVLSRRAYSTRWDERNIWCQCWACNYKAAMTAAASYHLWFVKRFGVDAFEQLYQDWRTVKKLHPADLKTIISDFESKIKTLDPKWEPKESIRHAYSLL